MDKHNHTEAIVIILDWFFSGRIHLENNTKGIICFKNRAERRFGINNVILSEPIHKIGNKFVGEFIFNEKTTKKDLIVNSLKRKGSTYKLVLIDKIVPISKNGVNFEMNTKIIEFKSASNTSGINANIYVNLNSEDLTVDAIYSNKENIENSIGNVITKFYNDLVYISENVTTEFYSYVEEAIKLTKHNEEELSIENIESNCMLDVKENFNYPVFTKLVEMYLEYIN